MTQTCNFGNGATRTYNCAYRRPLNFFCRAYRPPVIANCRAYRSLNFFYLSFYHPIFLSPLRLATSIADLNKLYNEVGLATSNTDQNCNCVEHLSVLELRIPLRFATLDTTDHCNFEHSAEVRFCVHLKIFALSRPRRPSRRHRAYRFLNN